MDFHQRIIAPSILASDFAKLGEEARAVERAGADWLHMDVMDGHFVDNISFGPAVVAAVGKSTTLPMDVHLMIDRPDRYYPRFADAGARIITVHVEAEHDVEHTLKHIRAVGCLAGLALNPDTPMRAVEPYFDRIDLLLVMTVFPGFGGQMFMASTMEKVRGAAEMRQRKGLSFHIEVDGGINAETATIAARHGANVFVGGTYVFTGCDLAEKIRSLRG